MDNIERKIKFIHAMTKHGLQAFAQGDQVTAQGNPATTLGGPDSRSTSQNAVNPDTGLAGTISGALGLTDKFQAGSADIQAGTNQGQLNQSYNDTQNALTNQNNLVSTLSPQAQAAVNQQAALAQMYTNQANGRGANVAQNQLNQATGQNIASQAALMAGQRGAAANPGLIARQAAQQGAATQQQAAGQAATLGAQQQIAAQNALANLSANQVSQTGQAITNQNNAQQNEQNILQQANTAANNAAVGMQSNINNVNAQTAAANQNMNSSILGGIMSGGGGIASALGFAEGGDVDSDEGSIKTTSSESSDKPDIQSTPSLPAPSSSSSSGGGLASSLGPLMALMAAQGGWIHQSQLNNEHTMPLAHSNKMAEGGEASDSVLPKYMHPPKNPKLEAVRVLPASPMAEGGETKMRPGQEAQETTIIPDKGFGKIIMIEAEGGNVSQPKPTGDSGKKPEKDTAPYEQTLSNGWNNLKSELGIKKADGGPITGNPLVENAASIAPQSFVGQWLNSSQNTSGPNVQSTSELPKNSESFSKDVSSGIKGYQDAEDKKKSKKGSAGELPGAGYVSENTAPVGTTTSDGSGAQDVADNMGMMNSAEGGKARKKLASKGGHVKADTPKEKAKVRENSYKNDKIPAMLSEGEIVLPRSITMHQDAPDRAAKFVMAIMAKKGLHK